VVGPLRSVVHYQCDANLRLPSQPQIVTAHWPVPCYAGWWQGHNVVNNLPTVVTQPRPERESNSRPLDHQSDARPVASLRHAKWFVRKSAKSLGSLSACLVQCRAKTRAAEIDYAALWATSRRRLLVPLVVTCTDRDVVWGAESNGSTEPCIGAAWRIRLSRPCAWTAASCWLAAASKMWGGGSETEIGQHQAQFSPWFNVNLKRTIFVLCVPDRISKDDFCTSTLSDMLLAESFTAGFVVVISVYVYLLNSITYFVI